MPLDEPPEVLVVADHAHQVGRQRACAVPVQQVVQAVTLPAHQHEHLLPLGEVVQRPLHAELVGHGPEAVPHLRGAGHVDAHEEAPAVGVAVLLAVADVRVVRGQEAGHGVHDTDPVGTREGQDKIHPTTVRRFARGPGVQPSRSPSSSR